MLATKQMNLNRRYLTFSLRTLFVVTAALAIWLGIIVNRAREQREAVKAIEALAFRPGMKWRPAFFEAYHGK